MMKLFTLFITALLISNHSYTQDVIINGTFDWNSDGGKLFTDLNPAIPCGAGIGEINNEHEVLPFWGVLQSHESVFSGRAEPNFLVCDSRWTCDAQSTYNSTYCGCTGSNANDVTCNECAFHFQHGGLNEDETLGIPDNYFGTQEHRTPVNHSNGQLGRYVGLSEGEIQATTMYQQLAEPLECGVTYRLTYYAVKKAGGDNSVIAIRFASEPTWFSNLISFNDDEQDFQKRITETGGTNSDQWQKVTQDFVFTDPVNAPTYIMFRTRGRGDVTVFIDDISLVKTNKACIAGRECRGKQGCISPTFTNLHTNDSPFSILNIGNVNQMDITLFSDLTGQLIDQFSVKPAQRWDWDGKASNGSELADATYVFQVRFYNDCFIEDFTTTMVKSGTLQNLSNKDECVDCLPLYSRDDFYTEHLPCCGFEPDINISNTKIGLTQEFKAVNNINVGQNVEIIGGSNILFQAGGTITIDKGTVIRPTANVVTLELTPCPKSGGIVNNGEEDELYSKQPSGDNVDIENSKVHVFPNPAQTTFTLSVTENDHYHLQLMDVTGKIVLELDEMKGKNQDIDVSHLENGIYFLKLTNANEQLTERIVIAR